MKRPKPARPTSRPSVHDPNEGRLPNVVDGWHVTPQAIAAALHGRAA